MFEREAMLFRFVGEYYRRLVSDLPDEQLGIEPVPGVKPPVWILGHLAICNDYALKPLGQTGVCAEPWHKAFGPGSVPLSPGSVRPSKQELVDRFQTGHQKILNALPAADPVVMAQAINMPMAFLNENFPTVGDLLAHLMTTHPTVHLGQLSTWRKVQGFADVLV